MKKSVKIILIAIMLLAIICAVTACVTETTIAVSGDPKIVLEKGGDLDLSSIKLTVSKGSSLSEIALDAEGVTVSGFDKNSVGEQTLTITYDGANTTLKINVVESVEPVVAIGHVTDYVVGEAFNDAGILKITKDDGETLNVRINDEKVQLSGFDSTTAGEKTINVTYTDGSLVLSGSFSVNVWNSDSVRLIVPTKKFYDSHETEINTSGGYLSVTAKSGAITKTVEIKEEWIKGFDPDVVTEEEPKKTQVITIDYPGQSVKYNIEIKLTDITRIHRAATALASLDWSGETPCEVSDEQGQIAMRALALYNSLDAYDALFVPNEDMINIIRPAAVYGTQAWTNAVKEYAQLLTVKSRSISIICDQLETVQTQFNAISALEETDPLFTYGDILINAAEIFGETTVYGEVTFSDCIKNVCDTKTVQTAITKVDLMLKMHEALEAVPANWQVSDLQTSETSAKIEQAIEHTLALGELTDSITERYLFNNVSQWRSKNDYFEILYRYYFEMYLSDDEEAQKAGVQGIDNLIDVCMPGILETYYLQYIATLIEQYDLQYTVSEDGMLQSPANSIDTVSFIMAYRSLLKIRQSILDSDDEMILTLFDEYSLNNIVYQIQTSETGAYAIFGAALDVPEFDNIWTKYLDTIIAFGEASSYNDNVEQAIKELFEQFIALTPELQLQFLGSLNPYGWMDFYVEDGVNSGTMFEYLIVNYYKNALPQSLISGDNSIAFDLFDAFQYYLYRGESTGEENLTYIGLFVQVMADVETMYGQLTGDDKTAFDNSLGFFYERLIGIYRLYNEEGNFVEKEIDDEWAEAIAELEGAYSTLVALFFRAAYGDSTAYPVFLSAYEYTVDLYAGIIAEAPQDVVDKVLYANKVVLFEGIEEMEMEFATSYEALLYMIRNIYISMLLEYPVDSEYTIMAWEEYNDTNLREYFAYLLEFYSAVTVDDSQITDEMVKEVLSKFQSLTDDEKALFVAMDGYGQFVYYKGLGAYFAKKFTDSEAAKDLVEEIINIELHCFYDYTKQDFVDAWKEVQSSYEALSEEDKALFDEVLKDTYDYYNNIYAELTVEDTASSESSI